jgi:hypothetical protein
MPNWVYNSLTVEGNPDMVNELKKQLNTPFTRMHDQFNMETGQLETIEYTFDNPIFSFWNIIRPLDMDAYEKQPDHSRSLSETLKFESNDWYSWNIRNWGTKWDVGVSNDEKWPDTELLDEDTNGDNLVLVYKFNTAWSPAFPAMEKLSAQYPELLLTLNYQEETGWGGEAEFLRGEMISDADYNWECSACGYQELGEPPFCEDCEYDMCPKCGYGEPDERCEKHHNLELDIANKVMVELGINPEEGK